MTKYLIDKDEWWPVYSIVESDSSWEGDREFTDEEKARIDAAFAEFEAVQDLIYKRGAEPARSNSETGDVDETR